MRLFTLLGPLAFILLLTPASKAQFLKKLQKSIQDKVEQKIEEKLVDAISKAIVKELDKQVDSLLQDEYKKSEGIDPDEEVDWTKEQDGFSKFLSKLNTSAKDLPATYRFDLQMEMESKTDDGKIQKATRLYSSNGNAFGIIQNSKDKKNYIVIDVQKDIIVLYTTQEDGSKSAQALPSMLHLTSSLLQKDKNTSPSEITKTGRTKPIAGYPTEEYLVKDDNTISHVWVAPNFPFEWKETYARFIQKFTPGQGHTLKDTPKGMPMEIAVYKKSKAIPENTTTTIAVSNTPLIITNSEYTFTGMER